MRLKRDTNYDIDTIRPSRYNTPIATHRCNHTTQHKTGVATQINEAIPMNEQTIRNILTVLNKHGVQTAIKQMDCIGKRNVGSDCRYGSLLRMFAAVCVEQCKHLVNHRDLLNAISIANEFASNRVKLTVVEKIRGRVVNAARNVDEADEASEMSDAADACVNLLLDDAYESALKVQQDVVFALAREKAKNAIADRLAKLGKMTNLSSETIEAMQRVESDAAFDSVRLMIKGLLQKILESELKQG